MFPCSSTSQNAPAFAANSPCFCHSPLFACLNTALTKKVLLQPVLAAPGSGKEVRAIGSKKVSASGATSVPGARVVFNNVRIFDGKSDKLLTGLRVRVEGETIKAIEPAENTVIRGAVTIDGGGRTLMPGLIDAHWHAMFASVPLSVALTGDFGYINHVAAAEAERTLMRGFTSVRDMAGPSFGLKRAIDEGVIRGPRIWPSGAMTSQTSGHGDFRFRYEVPAARNAPLSRMDATGSGAIADGVDEVLRRAREQLMLGASQLKLAAGGGVVSDHDPLDASQYTEAEFRAGVDAAENWGTYVAVHAYTPRAIQTAIKGGVRCIEHGQLMDEATAELIGEKDVWLSTQPFLNDEDAARIPEASPNWKKYFQVVQGTETAYGFAMKHKLKTAWGTDTLFDQKLAARQGAQLSKMRRWYGPAEVLKMATSTNGELLAMSGPRNPYPGRLGVVEAGALADLLLVDGDPITNLDLVADPHQNFLVIMKGGQVFKNALV
jgi:imidazolonepropionase-like amidohydrolase